MAGAFSLFLGMFGLGAAGAVSAGQNAKIKKADYQYGEEHGLHGTSEVLQIREQVRKEWWSICGKAYNAYSIVNFVRILLLCDPPNVLISQFSTCCALFL